MKAFTRKTISILLSLLMALSVFSVVAFAEAPEGYTAVAEKDAANPEGTIYFDRAAFVAMLDPESASYEMMSNAQVYYQTTGDTTSFVVVLPGSETPLSLDAPQYTFYRMFLHKVGEQGSADLFADEGFAYVPLSQEAVAATGGQYFDYAAYQEATASSPTSFSALALYFNAETGTYRALLSAFYYVDIAPSSEDYAVIGTYMKTVDPPAEPVTDPSTEPVTEPAAEPSTSGEILGGKVNTVVPLVLKYILRFLNDLVNIISGWIKK